MTEVIPTKVAPVARKLRWIFLSVVVLLAINVVPMGFTSGPSHNITAEMVGGILVSLLAFTILQCYVDKKEAAERRARIRSEPRSAPGENVYSCTSCDHILRPVTLYECTGGPSLPGKYLECQECGRRFKLEESYRLDEV